MKVTPKILLVVLLFFSPATFLGAELLSNETRHAQYEKAVAHILDSNASPAVVKQEIERLGKMYESQPDLAVLVLGQIVSILFSNNNSNRWSELIGELNQKILVQKPESNQGKGRQIGTIVSYMTFDQEDLPSDVLTNRKIRVSKLLELWHDISNSIEHDWDVNDNKNILQPYWPSGSLSDGFTFGQSPESIKDPKVKKEYTEYLEKREALTQRSIEQKQAKDVVREEESRLKKYIIDSYSLHPFATSELEQLLKDHKVDEAFTKGILEAVRKAEKDTPQPSEYRNWESKDALFKTKAKFVSSDGKSVTLEKEDGKQTTMTIDDLRAVDQRFVKEVSDSKQ